MRKYRKKPEIIEAMLFDRKNYDELREFTENKASRLSIPRTPEGKATCTIKTMLGDATATEGDYIIKDMENDFYPCKPDIFQSIYEKVE